MSDTAASSKKIGSWIEKRLGFQFGSKPAVRILFYPRGDENPYMFTLKQELEELGARVDYLDKLDLKELIRLRPFYDVLHIMNIKEYDNPFGQMEITGQLKQLLRHTGVLFAARRIGYRLFWTVYNDMLDEKEEPIERLGRKLVFSMAHKIICLTRDGQKNLRDRYHETPPDKFQIIPHHSLEGYYPCDDSLKCHDDQVRLLGEMPKGRVFLAFGAVHPYKGLTDLIPLFGRPPLDEHTLLVVGSPSNPQYARTIKSLAEPYSNVHTFIRYVARNEVQSFFKISDYYVIPPKQIRNPGSLMLALSFGLPIIAPRAGVFEDILNKRAGVLYEYSGARALKEALVKALEMETETARQETRRLQREFRPSRMARRLINTYLGAFPGRERFEEEESYEI